MKKTAYFFLILSGVLWGTMGIFVRTLYAAGFSPMQLIAVRSYVSAAVLVLFLLIRDRSKLKIRLRDSWCFVGTGIVSFVFFNYCYFFAIGETSLSVAAILLYTSPIFVMVLSLLLFKEKMNVRKVIALLLAFWGCILVTGIGQSNVFVTKAGIIAGLLSGFLYALYSIFGRYALNRYTTLTVTTYTFIFASIGVTPFADIGAIPALVSGNSSLVFFLLLFVLVTSIVPYLLYTKGLSAVETSKAAIMVSVEPVVATLIGLTVFGEHMTLLSGIGIAAVIVALFVLNMKPRIKNNPKQTI